MEEARLAQIEASLISLRGDLADVLNTFTREKVEFKDLVQLEFANQKLAIGEVVEGARKEFFTVKAAIDDLYYKTAQSVQALDAKVIKMEASGSHGGSSGGMKGYLPQKQMVPKAFSDKAEDWRTWQEEIEDYLDSVNPGMKELLKEVDKEEDPIDEIWRQGRSQKHPPRVIDDK